MKNYKKTNNKDSLKVISTIADDIIVEFNTEKKELKEFLLKKKIYDAKLEAIRDFITFPDKENINSKTIFG